MTVGYDAMWKILARVAVIGMVAVGASACSSVPDWVDPTTWIGGGGPSDNEHAAGETPDLASIPDRPAPASTADEQQQVAQSLAADRSSAKYSADALRGGTEAAAPPPPPPSAVASNDLVVPQGPSSSTPAASAPASQPTQVASNEPEQSVAPAPEAAAAPDTSAQAAPPPPPAATALPPAQPQPQEAAAASRPAYTPPATSMASVSPSDAALGFKPSTAPPLDASIGQFVSPPIVARYDQTANQAGMSAPRMASAAPAYSSRSSRRGVGGPEAMSGSVVANLDALQTPSAATSVYAASQGGSPASVVLFPGDGTLLTAAGRAQVRAAVDAFKAAGGQGFLRVVGHASSRTSNMPLEKHLEIIFNKSQDRANAVAQEAIREGVPANRVLVEAVGDTQPVYYESMPKGEDGNRRAEIYLQS